MKKVKLLFLLFFIIVDILVAGENTTYNEEDFFGSWYAHIESNSKIKIYTILDTIENYSSNHIYTTKVDAKFIDEKNNLIAIYKTKEKGLWKISDGKFITKINECKFETIKKEEDNPDFFIVDLIMNAACDKEQKEQEREIISISPDKFVQKYKDDKNVTVYTKVK